ncbi:MAG: sulfotransferase family 2 domain-containing protein [Phycisphaerales bacterium JB039]
MSTTVHDMTTVGRRLKADVAVRLRRHWLIKGRTLRDFIRLRCVFIHVPKCGGVAITESLFGHRAGGHLMCRDYERIFQRIYGIDDFPSYYRFAFIRNPWDRLHSAYQFLRAGGMLPADRHFAEQHLARYATFGDFVKRWVNEQNISLWLHFWPQVHFLQNAAGRIDLSFIGRFETMESDYNQVRERLGAGSPLLRRNSARAPVPYIDAYDDESRAIVARVYREDIARLDYTFAPGESP